MAHIYTHTKFCGDTLIRGRVVTKNKRPPFWISIGFHFDHLATFGM